MCAQPTDLRKGIETPSQQRNNAEEMVLMHVRYADEPQIAQMVHGLVDTKMMR
jgi:hypothetical protein